MGGFDCLIASRSPLREEYENKGVLGASATVLHHQWWISAKRPIFTCWRDYFLGSSLRFITASLRESNELRVLDELEAPSESALNS